jgi:hypothetical protein
MPRTRDELETLEGLMDKMGVSDLIEALGDIAHEKAEHVLENWQDRNLARRWTRLGEKLQALSSKIDDPYFQ